MELQTGVLTTLAYCYLGMSLRHQYDIIVLRQHIYDLIGIRAWKTVYAMLHHIFNDMTN